MTFKKVQEAKQIGTQMVKGEEVPLLQPEVFVEVKNKKDASEETPSKDKKIKAKKTKTDPNLFLFSDVFEETSSDKSPVQNEGTEISDITEINTENELLEDIDTPSYLRKGSNQ